MDGLSILDRISGQQEGLGNLYSAVAPGVLQICLKVHLYYHPQDLGLQRA